MKEKWKWILLAVICGLSLLALGFFFVWFLFQIQSLLVLFCIIGLSLICSFIFFNLVNSLRFAIRKLMKAQEAQNETDNQ